MIDGISSNAVNSSLINGERRFPFHVVLTMSVRAVRGKLRLDLISVNYKGFLINLKDTFSTLSTRKQTC